MLKIELAWPWVCFSFFFFKDALHSVQYGNKPWSLMNLQAAEQAT